MRITSAEANKLINKLNDEINIIKAKENDRITYRAAVGENPEELKPDYNFRETQDIIAEKEREICRVKHLLNVFNSTTEVEDGLTIDQVLVRLPQLNHKRYKLSEMVRKPEKRRVGIVGNVIDYEYLSYSPDEAREEYEKTIEEIERLQTNLDMINVSITFEI